jgi:hypothetical protein
MVKTGGAGLRQIAEKLTKARIFSAEPIEFLKKLLYITSMVIICSFLGETFHGDRPQRLP